MSLIFSVVKVNRYPNYRQWRPTGIDSRIRIYTATALGRRRVDSQTLGRLYPDTHFIGGSVDPRTSLDKKEWRKSPPLQHPGRPARSQASYHLSYMVFFFFFCGKDKFKNWSDSDNCSLHPNILNHCLYYRRFPQHYCIYDSDIKLNLWCYSSEEPRPTEAVAARWQYRGPCG